MKGSGSHASSPWRDWSTALAALPPLAGELVLDLGCGVGDQAAELLARGARVIGFDANEELLDAARARTLEGAEFHGADLRALPELDRPAAGLWCSFASAYFVELAPVLQGWARALRPGGWIALTEIDDLFAHEPLGARTRELLEAYAQEAVRERRYDFRMGRTIRSLPAGPCAPPSIRKPDGSSCARNAVSRRARSIRSRATSATRRCGQRWSRRRAHAGRSISWLCIPTARSCTTASRAPVRVGFPVRPPTGPA